MEVRKDVFIVLKYVTISGCLVAFILNVYGTSKAYFNDATMVLTSIQNDRTKLPLPILLICYSSPFKHFPQHRSIYNDEEYYNLTENLDNLLLEVAISTRHQSHEKTWQNVPFNRISMKELKTQYMGRCLSIQVPQKVSKRILRAAISKE